ncbi:MAG: gamma-glutamyltransferase [Marivibrio sp.]|uniref:gamma-glutamyltransferase n=1 Tax=Marivibrio sp. TaxID=2039719 RepID=UPI0032EACD19
MSGRGGAVAAGDPATAAAAAEVLAAGGSACDAALAGMLAACVAEPVLCSLGGGGFLLSAPADGDAPRIFDFFCQTPGGKRPQSDLDFREIVADFGTATQAFHIGRAAAAVPGIPAGLFAVHAARGRLPLREIAAPAIRLAREGHPIGPFQALLMRVVSPIMLASDEARALMADAHEPGATKREGAVRRLPAFADAVETMVAEGPRWFYEGEPAAAIADQARDGGLLTRADMAAYAAQTRAPLEARALGARALTNPAPSAGGALIAAQLAVIERLAPGRADLLSAVAGAMGAAVEGRAESGLTGAEDLQAIESAAERLLAPATLDRLAGRARKIGGTTHISVVDAAGDLAALSLSNGEGNGEIIPGAEQMMNNMLGEEDLNPRGFFQWREGERIASMMAPTALLTDDGRRVALGSGGSNRIRSAIFHTAVRLLAEDLPLEAAIAAPRLHVEGERLEIEGGFRDEEATALAALWPDHRLWPERNVFFGGVHGAEIDAAGAISAAGDPRRGGVGEVVPGWS